MVEAAGFERGVVGGSARHPVDRRRDEITEKFRRINYGSMDVEITVDNPKAYTRPWSVTLHQDLALNTELMEYFCSENEKDRSHLRGQ